MWRTVCCSYRCNNGKSFFEVNKALISRSTVFMLNPLTNENIIDIIVKPVMIKSAALETLT